jgi:outer membrane protein TolC
MFGLARADSLRPQDVWLSVEATHPLLDAQRARVSGAEFERIAAAGALDPVVGADAFAAGGAYAWTSQSAGVKVPLTVWGGDAKLEWRRGVGDFAAYDEGLETSEPGEVVVGFDLPLLRDAWTDRKRTTLRRAARDVDIATAELDLRRLDLQRAASHRYWDWVGAGARVAVATELLRLAEARDRAFGTQVELGEVAPLVREDSRRLVLERSERVIQAHRSFEQAQIELSMFLRDGEGRPARPPLERVPATIAPPPRPIDVPAAADRAAELRPELSRFDASIAQADVELRLAANQLLPAVDLYGEGALGLGDDDDQWKVGATVDGSALLRAARGRRGSTRALRDRLVAERAFAVDRVRADVVDAASALEAALARVATIESLVETARVVAEGERARLAIGDSNLIFVNQREIAEADARALRIDAAVAAWKAEADWWWAQGGRETR